MILSHLIPEQETQSSNITHDYLSEILVDPDNILSNEWKNKFFTVCRRFSHVITPRPGKYNGYYGRIDNSINFASSPPPSVRAHLPKYNHEKLKIMADKMDKLEEWGVLKKPENVGIVPEFVLPSMLTPKSDSNEWRLVTDFTPLNVHNYFYQGGMKIEDCQYLATPHPFKGLRIYVCEPQGLKNASEHAYERLGLVYGDLCASVYLISAASTQSKLQLNLNLNSTPTTNNLNLN